jgi:hypothetical protein
MLWTPNANKKKNGKEVDWDALFNSVFDFPNGRDG